MPPSSSVSDLYKKVFNGYQRLAQVYLGHLPFSALGKDASVLWAKEEQTAASASVFIGSTRDPIEKELLLFALEESKMDRGHGFNAVLYLTFLFFAERWLRSLKNPEATSLADLARYYRCWDGKTIFQHRFTRGNEGFESVFILNEFGNYGAVPIKQIGNREEWMVGYGENVWLEAPHYSLVPFLHPALFQPMLTKWRSKADDKGICDPWYAWKKFVSGIKIPHWQPLSVGFDDGLAAVPTSWKNTDMRMAVVGSIDIWNGDFSGSRWEGAMLRNVRLTDCTFTNSRWRDAYLTGVYFHVCKFTRSNFISASMSGSTFDRVKIDGCNFSRANMGMTTYKDSAINKSRFVETDLSSSRFGGSAENVVTDCVFSKADLESLKTDNSVWERCCFHKAKMNGATMTVCTIKLCDFTHANLRRCFVRDSAVVGCNFSDSDLYESSLKTDLKDSSFDRANMSEILLMDGLTVTNCSFVDAQMNGARLPHRWSMSRFRGAKFT